MRLQAIDDTCSSAAAALLARGFPDRPTAFWEAALARLLAYGEVAKAGPIGQMMMVGDAPVGVILTIPSRRGEGSKARNVINLSSWHVDEKHRWLAPRMLQKIIADDAAIYTDLTPTPETKKINERLGFRTVGHGVMLFALPWTALTGARDGRVLPFERIPPGALSPGDQLLLAHHRDLGCIAAALETEGRCEPLLFSLTRRYGMPVARLVFAGDRHRVGRSMAAIARFLLRRGALVLAITPEGAQRLPGGVWCKQSDPVQVRGEWERGRLDQTFSEFVFLRI
ncbi:MAG: hypothetical protein K2Z80_02480 [Xanthobacteraceae bacterium]|nr:hypothetical protein [Xanthobacteraceae bacterium]